MKILHLFLGFGAVSSGHSCYSCRFSSSIFGESQTPKPLCFIYLLVYHVQINVNDYFYLFIFVFIFCPTFYFYKIWCINFRIKRGKKSLNHVLLFVGRGRISIICLLHSEKFLIGHISILLIWCRVLKTIAHKQLFNLAVSFCLYVSINIKI